MRPGSGEVAVFDAASAIAVLDSVDLVFPVLHGAYGEDGTIQGLLEMAGVGYVGSGVLASAAAMDKAFAKTMLRAAGLDVGRFLVLRPGEPVDDRELERLGLPVFVKPARAGSSIGISKVRGYDELPAALKLAFEHDSKVLIEAAVVGREIECGVLQDADGSVSASLPAEIRLRPDFDWYSFEAKYLEDASEFDIPADVGADAVRAIQDASCRAFRALDCAGLARVDFFLQRDGRLVVNEVNTMPGFTAISMYPKMWAETGVSYPELLDRLIATALSSAGAELSRLSGRRCRSAAWPRGCPPRRRRCTRRQRRHRRSQQRQRLIGAGQHRDVDVDAAVDRGVDRPVPLRIGLPEDRVDLHQLGGLRGAEHRRLGDSAAHHHGRLAPGGDEGGVGLGPAGRQLPQLHRQLGEHLDAGRLGGGVRLRRGRHGHRGQHRVRRRRLGLIGLPGGQQERQQRPSAGPRSRWRSRRLDVVRGRWLVLGSARRALAASGGCPARCGPPGRSGCG